jgi:Uri superfamily endonuclease
MFSLPPDPGSYILELYLKKTIPLQVGRLGVFTFPAGAYLYFGSACGPGGLRSRLSRHLNARPSRPLHWHIDYLNAVSKVQAFCYLAYPDQGSLLQRLECRWSQAVAGLSGVSVPAPGFGASDCRCGCPAHLVAIQQPDESQAMLLDNDRLRKILAIAAGAAAAHAGIKWHSSPGDALTEGAISG